MNPFEIMIKNLAELGFFGFLLPFILAFAIVFALLLKSKILGEDKKIIGTVSLVISFFVIAFGGVTLGNFFVTLFGLMIIILSAILVIILILSMAGYDITKLFENKLIIIGIIIAAILLAIFIGNFWGTTLDMNWIITIAFIFVMILVAALLAKDS